MSNDFNELEEILKRIREENSEPEKSEVTPELEPPKTREELQAQAEAEEEPELEWLTAEEAENEGDGEKKKVSLKPNFSVIKANFKTRFMPKVKAFFKKVFTRQLLIAVGIILALLALIFGGIKLYDYSKTAYLRPYIEKYGVEYPEGIREEFCDDYGRDQKTAGRLVISDSSTDVLVTGSNKGGTALLDKGSTVLKEQHLRSITLDKVNIETYYATPDSFVNASQLVTFKTLFDDEEYKVVAAYYVNTNPEKDGGYVFPYTAYGNMTERSFKSYADWVKTMSDFTTGEKYDYDGYYLSINSPSAKKKDARFVILCRKVDGDFEKTVTTKKNKRVYKTQSWYEENGKQNPFRFASHWYPEIYTDGGKTKTKKLTAEDFR